MLFTQPIFLLFFTVVFGVAWTLRSNGRRKLWLLAASYLFYAGWDWRFLGLIWVSTLVDYCAGSGLARTESPGRRRGWLVLSLVCNLGILGFFKYFNFFIESATALLGSLGVAAGDRALSIVLPVGISFYTFQSMSYTLDVYRGRLAPQRNLVDFALFVAFFPQLVAGPIVRATAFLPQLLGRPRWTDVDFRGALTLFLIGFVKKSCIADNVAVHVDFVFASPSLYSVLSVWIAVVLYAVQIYCDFSGYSDMAIACARLLGYELGPNFAFPYLAASVRDFWRRWHISLSTWLRDYLYISLGGSRGSRLHTYRNLMLTMVLGGLWHGAAWTFVLWGALDGTALMAQRAWSETVSWRPTWGWAGGWLGRWLSRWLSTAATFYFVCLAWIFFRAESFDQAIQLVRAFVLFDGGRTASSSRPCLGSSSSWRPSTTSEAAAGRGAGEAVPDWLFAVGYGAACAVALAFVPLKAEPFSYFQF